MQYFSLIPLISALGTFFLGSMVLLKNPFAKLHQLFFLFTMTVSVWLGASIMLLSSCMDPENAIFWDRAVYFGVILTPPVCLHFIKCFIDDKKSGLVLSFFYIVSLFFLIASQTDLFVYGLIEYSWGCHTKAGFFHHLFILYFAVFQAYLYFSLYGGLKTAEGLRRIQIKYVLIAMGILSLGGIGFLPAYGISVYPLSYISGLVSVFLFAYAIIRYRLMDIRLVLRKYSVYLASLASIVIPAFILKYLLAAALSSYTLWLDLAILAGAISAFPALKKRYYKFANKFLFSSLYDANQVIADLSGKLSSTLDIRRIYEDVADVVMNSIRVKSLSFLIYDKDSDEYEVAYNRGFKSGGKKFKSDSNLFEIFIKKNKPIIIEELKFAGYRFNYKFLEIFNEFKVSVIVPLNLKDKNLGLIAIGDKESGDMMNEEDINTLNIIGSQAALAINNALSYEEIKGFNARLERRIKEATRDLREANLKLMKLDETKSEFISIASHQLRTPLTIIKGYISMMLEKNFGEISESQEDALGKVYESNERLIQLVENLLNISRIESGRFQYTFEKLSLKDLADSVIDELSSVADKKGLALKYKAGKNLPKIIFDEEKMRQVLLNLIDNALKYTKNGFVSVELKKEKNDLVFSVSDSGIGMDKEDMKNLFKKFSRCAGTSIVHTEGTGLGLYVAKNIIEAHKGRIWAESKGRGKGSKFVFSLPVNDKKK